MYIFWVCKLLETPIWRYIHVSYHVHSSLASSSLSTYFKRPLSHAEILTHHTIESVSPHPLSLLCRLLSCSVWFEGKLDMWGDPLPLVTSTFLLLVVRPGAPLVASLLQVAMPFVTSSYSTLQSFANTVAFHTSALPQQPSMQMFSTMLRRTRVSIKGQ